MKELSFLSLLFLLITSFYSIYSQDEIKKYQPPEVIEGSNLTVSASPNYEDWSTTSGIYRYGSFSFNSKFTKWKFTNKLDYAFYLKPSFYLRRTRIDRVNEDTTLNTASASLDFSAAVDKYLYKNLLYFGLYTNNNIDYRNTSSPNYVQLSSAFLGTGRIVDARMVTAADNFEDVLISEKVITGKLPYEIKKKLTELLDKRENREFIARFKDDSEVEFFTQVESFLKEKGVINSPLGSRTVIKLFQALSNSKFLYLPFYKGYQFQISGNFFYSNIDYGHYMLDKADYEQVNNKLKKDISLSGMWGIPLSNRTELIYTIFFSFPIDTAKYFEPLAPAFYSPIIFRENNSLHGNSMYPISLYNLSSQMDYSYFAGFNIKAFHYLSKTIALTGELEYIYGKARNSASDKFYLNGNAQLIYNILNSLTINTGIVASRDNYSRIIDFTFGIGYYIF